ncbi:probable cytochrome P450 28d1 isoform X2 [Lucilia sericata]|uniref:probable cytochrome P450 28d1 isoform X2 n=1 Tax=Lucilia sericata TaxID=13632 RepID=UPI0018A83806|nr:probable cytochrome P450 28d1 isoform X2 [Lucilia sericata]
MFFCVISVSLSIIILIVYLYLSWNFNYWKRQNVAGPRPQLLKGTFPKTFAGKCNLLNELHEIYMHYKSSESYVGVFMARSPKLFILDPKLIKQILTQQFTKFRDNESSQWSSEKVEQLRFGSPFVSVGEVWREKRSELVQGLTVNRIRSHYEIMKESASEMIAFIKAQDPGIEWDAKELANRYTCHIMAKFIWGIDENTFEALDKISTIHEITDQMLKQALKCVQYYGKTAAWPWLRKIQPERFFPAVCDGFFKQLAKDVMEQKIATNNKQNDVINHLLQLKEKKSLNDVQIAGHTTTVLIDGYETGAIVIAHCLLLLARHQRVQEKLRQKLLEAGEAITYDQLMELPYLDQCIQETLRLFPPLATLFKICTESFELQNELAGSKVLLRPQDIIYISAYSLHYDPDYYENPEEFWPERFNEELGGVKKYKDMGVFLPFGDGPRICPVCFRHEIGFIGSKGGCSRIIEKF